MKNSLFTLSLFLLVTCAYAQTTFSSIFCNNASLTGAKQTPLLLGNLASGNSTPSTVPAYTFSTTDYQGSGWLEIHGTRWGGTMLLTREDPAGYINVMSVYGTTGSGGQLSLFNSSNQASLLLNGSGDSWLNGGNLAIGTNNAQGYRLAVNGSAIFTKAVVKAFANWPDYVFDPQYRLPSLDSLGLFVRENRHLPDIPSADSVARTGLDLGANQAALLKKIEELTLYTIEQNRQIAEMRERMQRLEGMIEQRPAHKKRPSRK